MEPRQWTDIPRLARPPIECRLEPRGPSRIEPPPAHRRASAVLAVPLLARPVSRSAHAGPQLARSAHAGTARTVASSTVAAPARPVAAPEAPDLPRPVINWAVPDRAERHLGRIERGRRRTPIDGDAGTDWCPRRGPEPGGGLSQVRSLSDLGNHDGRDQPVGSATIQVATQAGDCSRCRPPATSRWTRQPDVRAAAGRVPGARYAQLTVFSGTGADVCVGRVPDVRSARAAAGM